LNIASFPLSVTSIAPNGPVRVADRRAIVASARRSSPMWQ
jgi:hypothetical protein